MGLYLSHSMWTKIDIKLQSKVCITSTAGSPSYLDTSNNIDDDQSLDSTSLHSTIQGSGVATSGEVIMDSTLDSSDLTTLHPVTMATGEIVNSQHPLVSGVKSVNLGTRNNLGNSLENLSNTALSNVRLEAFLPQTLTLYRCFFF